MRREGDLLKRHYIRPFLLFPTFKHERSRQLKLNTPPGVGTFRASRVQLMIWWLPLTKMVPYSVFFGY
jgi:hypothetical protein